MIAISGCVNGRFWCVIEVYPGRPLLARRSLSKLMAEPNLPKPAPDGGFCTSSALLVERLLLLPSGSFGGWLVR